MIEQLLTQKDVTRILGIPHYRLEYWHKIKRIPEVTKVGQMRIYRKEDIEKIKEVLKREEEYR